MNSNHQKLTEFMARHNLKSPAVADILGQQPQTVRAKLCGVRAVTDSDIDRVMEWEREK